MNAPSASGTRLADAAPAMGMAGTIIGLIGMFARMNDPATIGPAMALALIATFDGMILANVSGRPDRRPSYAAFGP